MTTNFRSHNFILYNLTWTLLLNFAKSTLHSARYTCIKKW